MLKGRNDFRAANEFTDVSVAIEITPIRSKLDRHDTKSHPQPISGKLYGHSPPCVAGVIRRASTSTSRRQCQFFELVIGLLLQTRITVGRYSTTLELYYCEIGKFSFSRGHDKMLPVPTAVVGISTYFVGEGGGQLDGWKWDCLRLMLLDVSMMSRSVVQRLWDQYQSEDSVSRRPVPGRPRATTPAEDRFLALSARRRRTTTVPQLVADHFQASGRRISATTVRNRLHNAGLYARRPVVCVPLNGRQRRNRLCWAREHVSWTQQQWTSVLFTDESRFTMESDSGASTDLREQRTRYHQSNTVERHSAIGGGGIPGLE
ncbi:transposable element Tcb2 transposase [Trichonephila clavipes]|nr:transposable element Tcb2 transposase [Trichonephila clavipes]